MVAYFDASPFAENEVDFCIFEILDEERTLYQG